MYLNHYNLAGPLSPGAGNFRALLTYVSVSQPSPRPHSIKDKRKDEDLVHFFICKMGLLLPNFTKQAKGFLVSQAFS